MYLHYFTPYCAVSRAISRLFKQTLFVMILLFTPFMTNAYSAISCGDEYIIQPGDSLYKIADTVYGDGSQYILIYNKNKDIIKGGPSNIIIGKRITIPCLNDANDINSHKNSEKETDINLALNNNNPFKTEPSITTPLVNAPHDSAPTTKQRKHYRAITANDYKPFTDESLPRKGMMTEVIEEAFKLGDADNDYSVVFINDWSSHFNPLLKENLFDMGFPWYNPGCPTDHERCQFEFSDPLYEVPILLYTHTEKNLTYTQDKDLIGKTLCRPAGYFTHDLDRADRKWLTDKKITLKQPQKVKTCFDMVLSGEADAVAINDFTAREVIVHSKLEDKIKALPKELSKENLHLLVHRSHPDAKLLIKRFNRGLKALKALHQYDSIIDKHLALHWKNVTQ